jgi:hypothetical protein
MTIPLRGLRVDSGERQVFVQGKTYLLPTPATFQSMAKPGNVRCKEAPPDVSYRVVLEQ